MTKHLKALLITIIVLGIILLIALSLATRSTASFAYNYSTLFYLNITLIIVMSSLLLVLAYWLFQRLRNNVFGTRLLTRFALSFVLLAVIPSVLLFLISNLFISRTINSWFNLKLDSALTAGIDFGRDRLLLNRDITQDQLTRLVTQRSFSTPPNANEVQTILKQNNWRTLIGIDAQGKIVWRIDEPALRTANVTEHLPVFTPNLLQSIKHNWVQIEDEADNADRIDSGTPPRQFIHAIQAVDNPHGALAARWIYTQQIMPADFSARVNDIQNGLRDYQATETSRESLRNLYRVTLVIVLLVTLLAALAAAFLIANRMIQPSLWLAQATRQVAAGH